VEKIYAPWREKYVTQKLENGCVFCHQLKQNDDEKYFILKRFKHTFVIINLYPYNGGHLMVFPTAHKSTFDQCTQEERIELIETVNKCIVILQKELSPQGFNVGVNIGDAGGGGIPSHLHFHILPRWKGDTNFLPLLSDTKHVSVDLVKLYKRLKPHFK
jgi:ATP adenylyltransferase